MPSISAGTVDERALLASARAGDERAFRALVDPCRRALEVHCYRMLGSPHDAEDVAEETLLRAWRSLDHLERGSPVDGWLLRIATNACLDELERRPRSPGPGVEPYPDARLRDAGTPLADPLARHAGGDGLDLAFLTAVQRLPADRPVVWVYSGNPSYGRAGRPMDSLVVLEACVAALAGQELTVVLTTGHHDLPEHLLPLPTGPKDLGRLKRLFRYSVYNRYYDKALPDVLEYLAQVRELAKNPGWLEEELAKIGAELEKRPHYVYPNRDRDWTYDVPQEATF